MSGNILDMSDEDFEKMAVPDFTSEEFKGKDDEAGAEKDNEAGDENEAEKDEEGSPEDGSDKESADEETDDEDDKEEGEGSESGDGEDNDKDKDDKQESEKELDKDKPAEGETDWKSAYESVMGSFKANGTEFTPKSPEDAIRLMQMGVNYHDKMAGMKPARTALKTLENNDLLDEAKLATLIDASKGDIGAITKLIKDHGIDPLDLDTKVDSTYVPKDHSPSEEELVLDTVLDSIKGSPAYDRTADIISNKWDDASKTEVATNPHIISVINEHVDTGVYDTVMKEVTYKRSLGGLAGVSDLLAYQQVGNELQTKGVFDKEATSEKKADIKKKLDLQAEKDRLAKKKAASPTKTNKKKGRIARDFNPLDMSDEEFARFDKKTIGL